MVLIINLGLKSIRGIVFSKTGDQIYSKAFPVHTSLFNNKVEQDAGEWINLLNDILIDIKSNTDLSQSLDFMSVTTSSSCILGVDKDINPITKVLMVSDKRSELEVECIKRSAEFLQDKEEFNLQCATSSLIPKALWFKNNQPETFDKVTYWLGAAEFLNYYFTNQIFTDSLNASKAFYNGITYCTSLIESLGLKQSSLPEVKPIGSTFEVSQTLKKRYGLNGECKFVLTTYDAICAVIGSSNGQQNNACDVSGTVTSVRVLSSNEAKVSSGTLLSQYVDLLDKYMIGSSNNLGGGIIEWHKQAFFEEHNSDIYFKMENAANQSKIGSNGIIFLPYLLGERSPFIAPNATATFFGVKRNSTVKDFTRSVFESTAYVTRDLLELIESEGGINVDCLTVSGGLARFDLINQIKADVCKKPVYVVENFESTSMGSFILLALSTKLFVSIEEALKKAIKIRKIINPSESNFKLYDEYFKLFKEINSSLAPIYDRHKRVMNLNIKHESEIVRNL